MHGTVFATRVDHARRVARVVLADLPERWQHSAGVAARAEELAAALGENPDVLVAAAWLHDIGYAEAARDTGFHPLDGARYLDAHGWPPRISALVAHHSGACYVAEVRNLGDELGAYPREQSPLADALTYADQTVGPAGRPMPVEQRISDMLRRHGDRSPNAAAHRLRGPYLLALADRVESRLATPGR
ncbi:HD domain-containing protein [Actinoplanes sp. NPDC026623]|uniref:HD domain-containing protein n=1 Tax=Actinoplanes sp. NPDC026623 TaxID=3155610 RepID=UPI00340E7994